MLIVVTPLKDPEDKVAVPSVTDPPVTAPEDVMAPELIVPIPETFPFVSNV